MLRKDEPKAVAPKNTALEQYLKKYTSNSTDELVKKKKKKKDSSKRQTAPKIQIVDNDISGFTAPAAVEAIEEEQEDADGKASALLHCLLLLMPALDQHGAYFVAEGPVIANPEEAEALKVQLTKVSSETTPGTRSNVSYYMLTIMRSLPEEHLMECAIRCNSLP